MCLKYKNFLFFLNKINLITLISVKKLEFNRIPPAVLTHYQNIDRHREVLKRTKISVIKAQKVLPQTLTKTLTRMATRQGLSSNFEHEVTLFKIGSEGLVPKKDSLVKLFSFFTEATDEHSKKKGSGASSSSSLGIISGAARKYLEDETEVVDYYLAEYNFAPGEKRYLLENLGAAAALGVGGAALTVLTGGLAGIVGGVAGILGSSYFAKNAIDESGKAGRTEVLGNVNDVLMACFIHELVQQGHAKVENNQMVFIEL